MVGSELNGGSRKLLTLALEPVAQDAARSVSTVVSN